jgi:hypothetical protein
VRERNERGARGLLLALAAGRCAVALAAPASARADVSFTFQSADRAFSPNGDGQDDLASVSYALSDPATVDATIADSSGHLVRTVESGTCRAGCRSPCSPSSARMHPRAWCSAGRAG